MQTDSFMVLRHSREESSQEMIPDPDRKGRSAIIMGIAGEIPAQIAEISFKERRQGERGEKVFNAHPGKEARIHVPARSSQHGHHRCRFEENRESHTARHGQSKTPGYAQRVFQAAVDDPLAPFETQAALKKIERFSNEPDIRDQREINAAAENESVFGTIGLLKVPLSRKQFSCVQ